MLSLTAFRACKGLFTSFVTMTIPTVYAQKRFRPETKLKVVPKKIFARSGHGRTIFRANHLIAYLYTVYQVKSRELTGQRPTYGIVRTSKKVCASVEFRNESILAIVSFPAMAWPSEICFRRPCYSAQF